MVSKEMRVGRNAGRSAGRAGGLGVAAAALLALAAACGPIGPIPGGKLGGELVREPVGDWSFTREIADIQVETRPSAPYSVTTWCATTGDTLYVPSRDPKSKQWVRNVLADPDVRLRIDGRLYERRLTRVSDEDELARVANALIEKYELDVPDDPAARPEVWIFRVEDRT